MIIGISGKIGSGKDTLGMILQALTMEGSIWSEWALKPIEYARGYMGSPSLKGGWEIKKFATKLKSIASILLGVPVDKFENQEYKNSFLGPEWSTRELSWKPELNNSVSVEVPMTVREFLQKLGSNAMRDNLHQNVWVNALMANYRKMSDHELRGGGMGTNGPAQYPNWIITDVRFPNEVQAIKDKGGIIVRIDRPDNPYPDNNHLGETSLDNWEFDVRIINNGPMGEELVRQAREALSIAEVKSR